MNTPDRHSDASREHRLEAALAALLRAEGAGVVPDREAIVAEYPDLADELRSFFANRSAFDRFAEPLRGGDASTLELAATPVEHAGPCVPYFGNFEVIEEIARGGMGVVYKARQRNLDRLVAIKMILSGRLASSDDVRRFRHEAEAAAKLSHPNIVPIYEVGTQDGQCYFSMAFVAGGSLSDLIRSRRLSQRQRVGLMATVARAVHHAHQRGLLHRDLKPGNILLDENDQPHVTDFGLARRLEGTSDLTAPGAIVGTPSYMAPEQAAPKGELTVASDVYSLGTILYELLTGRPPFRGEMPAETLVQLLTSEPARPASLNPKIDRDLETVCLKCLERDPRPRYDSAAALADDLERWLRGEPVLARPITKVERFIRWCRRNPVVAGLGTLTLASVVAAAVAVCVGYLSTSRALQKVDEQRRRAENALVNETSARQEAESQRQRAETERDKADQHQYRTAIALAQQKWLAADVGETERILDDCLVLFRHWEWRYLKRLCHLDLITLRGHGAMVTCASFNPTGERLLTASMDGTAKVWDVASGQALRTLRGHRGRVFSACYSPNGARLATAGMDDDTVKLWDAQSGQEQLTIPAGKAWTISFSSDGARLATASHDGTATIWDAADGHEVLKIRGHSGSLWMACFSPDDTRLAAGGQNGAVTVWDAATGQKLLAVRGQRFCFSRDGQRLATAVEDGAAKIWNAADGQELLTLRGHSDGVVALAFSPDGKLLATGSNDHTAKVWDTATGKELMTLRGHANGVHSVGFHPDGTRLASGSADGTAKMWQVIRGSDSPVNSASLERVWGVAFSPDGKRLASGDEDNTASVWDTTTGQRLCRLRGHKGPYRIYCVAFDHDGKRLATAGHDQTTKLWDAENGQELLTLEGHSGAIRCVCFRPDGKRLATASEDGTAKIWDAESGEALLTLAGHATSAAWACFSPDGKRLATASLNDGAAKIWDADSGQELCTRRLHDRQIYCVAFDKDGKRLASGGSDRTVAIWTLGSKEEPLILRGHVGSVRSVCFNRDGARLATSGDDSTVKVWDAASGHELLTLRGHMGPVESVQFSPDGELLATGGMNHTAKIWGIGKSQEAITLGE